MRGSVIARQRADGSTVWCIKYYDRTGRQRWETIGPRKRDAERVLAERIAGIEGNVGMDRTTFSDFLPIWQGQKARTVASSTMDAYLAHVKNHLEPYFGRRQMRSLTLADLQRFVNAWHGEPNTLRKVLATMRGIINAAAVLGVMPPLDFSALALPRLPAGDDIRVLTITEVYQLMEATDERYAPDILFLAMTGLRRGEWIALPQDRVDLDSRTIRVIQTINNKGELGPPKGGQPRTVQLFDKAVTALLEKVALKAEAGLEDSPWAFPNMGRGDGLIQPSNWFNRVWVPAIRRAQMDDLRIHDLRHTAASLMIQHGAPPHFVANQLGHRDPAFTMRTYAHWFQAQNQAMVQQLNRSFSSSTVAVGSEGEADGAHEAPE